MSDLAAFLRARLREDEAAARGGFPAEPHSISCGYDQIEFSQPCDCGIPARVLADVAARREVLLLASDRADGDEDSPWGEGSYSVASHMGFVLRHVAAVYADHPDYDPAWRP